MYLFANDEKDFPLSLKELFFLLNLMDLTLKIFEDFFNVCHNFFHEEYIKLEKERQKQSKLVK